MLKTVTNSINASQIQTPITLPGDVTLSTGNLIIGTSGKGIDFSATPGTGTSELLADYEEGTWTPVVTAQTGTITSYTSSGTYTKIGRVVTLQVRFEITNAGTGSGVAIVGGFPFNAANTGSNTSGCGKEINNTGKQVLFDDWDATSAGCLFYDGATVVATANIVRGVITYIV